MLRTSLALATLICALLLTALAPSGVPDEPDFGALGQTPTVTIKEWDVPTANSRPHDPAVAPDGSLWYTGQMANKLGRLDPKTGQIKEFPLKTPDSGAHGLVADHDGNIWFTAIFKHYIGKLDPKTGEITEFPMPDPKADPHTPAFDSQGILWFTTQQGNMVGRLDPRSGQVKLKQVPTPHAVPYGIVVTPGVPNAPGVGGLGPTPGVPGAPGVGALGREGVPFICEFGSNKLARIDPQTMEIKEYVLPEGARPRRLALAADGSIYYSDYARGFLGRLDPASGKVEEWPSPGGLASKPYGIAITGDGMVWYSESGVSPNTLVSFDPKTRKFLSVTPIPSGGGVVRNMVATKDGKLYLACSGVNKVGIAEVK